MAWLVLPVGSEDVIMYPSRQQKGLSTMELIVKQRFFFKKRPRSVSEIEFLPIEGHFCVGGGHSWVTNAQNCLCPTSQAQALTSQTTISACRCSCLKLWQSARTCEACHLACNRQPSRFWMTRVCLGTRCFTKSVNATLFDWKCADVGRHHVLSETGKRQKWKQSNQINDEINWNLGIQ